MTRYKVWSFIRVEGVRVGRSAKIRLQREKRKPMTEGRSAMGLPDCGIGRLLVVNRIVGQGGSATGTGRSGTCSAGATFGAGVMPDALGVLGGLGALRRRRRQRQGLGIRGRGAGLLVEGVIVDVLAATRRTHTLAGTTAACATLRTNVVHDRSGRHYGRGILGHGNLRSGLGRIRFGGGIIAAGGQQKQRERRYGQ